MSTARQPVAPITVEQYERFEGYPGLRDELIYGEIVMSPQAKPLHQETVRSIERLLSALLENTPYVARQDTNIKFPALNSMPAPDVFVVERAAWLEACRKDEYLAVAPRLVVEVLSPANRKTRVEQKVELYLASNVQEVWVVDPKKRTVRVRTQLSDTLYGPEDSIQIAAIPGSVQLAEVFRLE